MSKWSKIEKSNNIILTYRQVYQLMLMDDRHTASDKTGMYRTACHV